MSILRIRSSVLCLEDDRLLALRYESPATAGFWGVPGGEIQENETPLNAAIRETLEETGYLVELSYDPQLVLEYDFLWDNVTYFCRTHWFCVHPRSDVTQFPHAGDEKYLTDLRWIPLSDRHLLFVDYPVIQNAIETILGQMDSKGLLRL